MTGQPALPPFSGDDPTCIKCGNKGARTAYRPDNEAPNYEPWGRLADAEHLERECNRCDFKWAEAIVHGFEIEHLKRTREGST